MRTLDPSRTMYFLSQPCCPRLLFLGKEKGKNVGNSEDSGEEGEEEGGMPEKTTLGFSKNTRTGGGLCPSMQQRGAKLPSPLWVLWLALEPTDTRRWTGEKQTHCMLPGYLHKKIKTQKAERPKCLYSRQSKSSDSEKVLKCTGAAMTPHLWRSECFFPAGAGRAALTGSFISGFQEEEGEGRVSLHLLFFKSF